MSVFSKLWRDDNGALIATEYLFVATILVIGTVVGLAALRNAINTELTELANALLALSQGFSIPGGEEVEDEPTVLAPPTNTPPAIPSAIDVQPCN